MHPHQRLGAVGKPFVQLGHRLELRAQDRIRFRQLAGREYGERTAPAVQRVRDAAGIRAITVFRRQHAEIRE